MNSETTICDHQSRNPDICAIDAAVPVAANDFDALPHPLTKCCAPAAVDARAQAVFDWYGSSTPGVLKLKPPELEPESALVRNVRAGHERGWSFTPLNGKRPFKKGWQKAPRETLDQAHQWAQRGNVGLRTGHVSAPEGKFLVVIDLDMGKPQYDAEAVAALELPQTVTVITGGDGKHLYFLSDEALGSATGQLPPAVDLRGRGGQVGFPGSVHPETGRLYRWADGLSPDEIEVAELPRHVIDLIKAKRSAAPIRSGGVGLPIPPLVSSRYGAKALKDEAERVAQAVEGERNDTLNSAAFNIGQLVASGDVARAEAEAALLEAGTHAGLPNDEVIGTIASGLNGGINSPRKTRTNSEAKQAKSGSSGGEQTVEVMPSDSASANEITGKPASYALTDLGNAERFAAANQLRALWCVDFKAWLAWDGKRWTRDNQMGVQRLAKDVVRSIYGEAEREANDEKRAAIVKWARASESEHKIGAMIKLARSELSITPEELDRHPWLLTVNNGVIDLKTGQLREHCPDDYLTQLAPVNYDPDAPCPLWESFLDRIFAGNREVIAFVQRLAGYFLTGSVREEILPIMYGEGANGKTTFINQLMHIMGNYASSAAPNLLMVSRNGNQAPYGVADLKGKRLIVASESDSGDRLSEGLVKKVTGRERLKARHLYGNFFEFDPTHKIILQTNHRPEVRGIDEGIWRRLVLLPFDVTIPRQERDKNMSEKLRTESPGIQPWAVRGCLDWQRHGLQPPEQVQAATRKYAEEANSFRQFFREQCAKAHDNWMSTKQIRTAYQAYCRERNLSPLGDKQIAKTLRSIGCTKKNKSHTRGWTGLKLLPEQPTPGHATLHPSQGPPPELPDPDESGSDNAQAGQDELTALVSTPVRQEGADPGVGQTLNPTSSITLTEEVNDDE